MPFREDPTIGFDNNFREDPSLSSTPNKKTARDSGIVKSLPTIGSIGGSFLGPLGTASGYATGKSVKEIINQLSDLGPRGLAELFSPQKGAELTPYAQQKLQQTGQKVPSQSEDFSIGNEAISNLVNDDWKDSLTWGAKTVGEAGIQGLLDYILGGTKALKPSQKGAFGLNMPEATGLIPSAIEKIGGVLTKAKGVKPATIARTSREAANDIWKPMQNLFDDALEKGKKIDVTDIIDDLEKQRKNLAKGIDVEKLADNNRLKSKLEGFDTVIRDLKDTAKSEISSLAEEGASTYNINPQAAQTLKSLFGEQSFNSRSGLQKVFSGLFESGEQKGRNIAGKELKDKIVKYLEEQGVEDATKRYEDWAKLNDLSNLSSQGFEKLVTKSAFLPSIVGTPLSGIAAMAGGGASSLGIVPALYGIATPYGRQLLREGVLKPSLNAVKPASNAILSNIMGGYSDQ